MAVIAIKQFGGISPKVPARYLPDSGAQVAINCPAFSGSLQPLQDVSSSVHTLTKPILPKTIYRFGEDLASDTQYWFHWDVDVDVVKTQVYGDTQERTFFTGDGAYPKFTNNLLALTGGTQYPIASYRLGVPPPAAAPVAVAQGTGDTNAVPEDRVYVFTYVNSNGEESAPSDASLSVTVYPGQTVALSSMATLVSGEYQLTHKRVYRSTSGTFLYVGEIPVASTSMTDNVSAEDLGEELPSLYWSMPPANLKGLIGLPNGIMAGFVGRDVYLCEPYRPFAWPEGYINTVDAPVVALGRMDTTLAVLTTGTPYFIQGAHPDSMTMVKSDIEQACVSKRSVVSFGGTVIYASPDGLVMLSPGGSKLITEQMFTRDQWQSLSPSSMHAYQHDRKYVCFYKVSESVKGGFIFDYTSGVFITHDIYAECGYADMRNDTLYLTFADRTVKKWMTGAAKSYTWKSKKFSLPRPVSFACAQLEAEAYPMTMKFYMSGVLVHTQTVTSRSPFRLPTIMTGADFEIEVSGSYEVFSAAMASSMSELKNV